MNHRDLLARLLAVSALVLGSAVQAQPGTPTTRIVVPVSAGGPMDTLARLIAPELAQELGQTVIVENRVGAQGAIGAESVARASADGRTLLMGAPYLATNAVASKSEFDPQKDLAPVALLTQAYLYLVAHESSGVRTVDDLRRIAATREKPLSCGSGPGSMAVACQVLQLKLDGKLIAAPYPGVAPAMVAILGGHVDVAFVTGAALPSIKDHPSTRVVGGLGNARQDGQASTVPLLMQTWPDWSTESFYALFAPAGTPAERIQALNAAVNKALANPRVAERLAAMDERPVGGKPDRLAAQLASDIRYYRRVAEQTSGR